MSIIIPPNNHGVIVREITHITDTPSNIALLRESDDQFALKLPKGRARPVCDARGEHTGWFSREIASDAILRSGNGGLLLFRENPLRIFTFESGKKPMIFTSTIATSFAIDNAVNPS